MELTNFRQQLTDAVEDLVSITDDSIRMTNCTFEETFPATTLKLVEVGGKKFQMKVEVTIKAIEE